MVDDVRRSVLLKAGELESLRAQTLTEGAGELAGAALAVRRSFDAGGRLFAFGNGGSATDAMDAVADFQAAPQRWTPRPALDLSGDAAILTALANDIGPEVLFQRQIIAYGRPGDVALALSTSGNSANVVSALSEARRLGLATVAMVGYDGGRVAAERLADMSSSAAPSTSRGSRRRRRPRTTSSGSWSSMPADWPGSELGHGHPVAPREEHVQSAPRPALSILTGEPEEIPSSTV